MQLSTFTLASLCLGGALATGTTVHVVKVGSTNSSLTYTPNSLKANVGDMVQFQFSLANHTVTQSTFDQPCQPIALNTNQTGMFSGFMPVKATDTMAPVYTIQVTSTTPMWLYCSQGKHCQAGMVMVINENTAANATRSLANYKAAAKMATANLAPGSSTSSTAAAASSAVASAAAGSGSSATSGNNAGSAASTSSGSATSSAATAASTGAAGRARSVDVVTVAAVALGAFMIL